MNFFDHTKILLSQEARVVTFVNRDRELSTFTLMDVFKSEKTEVISRLKYTRDVLQSLSKNRKPQEE